MKYVYTYFLMDRKYKILTHFRREPSKPLGFLADCSHRPRPLTQSVTPPHFHYYRGVVLGAKAGHYDAGPTF